MGRKVNVRVKEDTFRGEKTYSIEFGKLYWFFTYTNLELANKFALLFNKYEWMRRVFIIHTKPCQICRDKPRSKAQSTSKSKAV